MMQAGVELAGVAGPEGDADAIALAVEALAAVGLRRPTVDLGHLGLAREVLSALALPDAALAEARRCIAKHDGTGLGEVLKSARGSKGAIAFARLLPELSGAPRVLADAGAQSPNGGIKRALSELAAIVSAIEARKLDARLHVDLGEVRGFDYYTGVRFQAFVPGAASAVLQGGRYDDLLARYGRPSPAVGFAVDVDAVAGALESIAGAPSPRANG
jgi:ATP phosphoribosyltransferase regulatory subunit